MTDQQSQGRLALARSYGELMQAARAFSRCLKAFGEDVHADTGLSGAMPAILDRLKEYGPETVPEMARARGVARQSVQVLVNELAEQGLVEARPNPRHRRSPLMAITIEGRRRLAGLRAREAVLVSLIDAPLTRVDLDQASRTLATLETYLRSSEWRRRMAGARDAPDG